MKRQMQKLRDQKGLSLIEAVLAVMIVAVGFLGMLPLMTSATANTLSSNYIMTCTFLGDEQIETMIADKKFRGYNYIVNGNYPTQYLTGDFSQYTRSISVVEVNKTDLSTPQVGSGYKLINVTVTWNGQQNAVVSTLVTNF